MADRIERYLGRLEAELENRVEPAELEAMLLEVEGHLRESEEAYLELGEPAEFANRLAVEGFGGARHFIQMSRRKNPNWRGPVEILSSVVFAWVALTCVLCYYYATGTQFDEMNPIMPLAVFPLALLSCLAGSRRWLMLSLTAGLFVFMVCVGALLAGDKASAIHSWYLGFCLVLYLILPVALSELVSKFYKVYVQMRTGIGGRNCG